MLNTMEKSLLWGSKMINPNPPKQKTTKLGIFFTKSILTQNIKFHAQICFKNNLSCVSWLCPDFRITPVKS